MSVSLMALAFAATVSPTQKLVLLALCDSANDRGECYPAMLTLAEKCSLSERATQGAVAELERSGYLRRELRKGRATVYWLTPAAGAPRSRCTPQEMHPAADAPAPADAAPITITQPPEEQKTKTPPASPTGPKPDPWLTIEAMEDDGIGPEVAAAWLSHRKAKKAKLTALAWAGFKREADKAGWPYEQAVLKAIARNWTGFEAAWVAGDRAAATVSETAYQRSMRERIAEVSPGLARKAPGAEKPLQEVFDVAAKRIA